ncbi:Nucleostemin-like protein [Oopsacas minuta]|uniref:Nucleostemin-like protein n=1 Tax=Oopsacas minuta TaxID=111878 RepID=A0AAV7JK04_9METZ|nr:Nucleostemin-like protein [Oopsacas minuta]
MVKKNKKVQSKRMTCSRRYKIQRRVREHIRKSRKEDKSKSKSGLSILKKDPGIPRLHPMKEQILREVEQHKQQAEIQKIAHKTSLKRLQIEAKKKNKLFDKSEQPKYTPIDHLNPNSEYLMTRKAFYKEFQQVVDASDIVIEVLDARDPLPCRNTQAETMVSSSKDKRLVLLLNKADLVPREVTLSWLRYLRREYPTIAFKSSTQSKQRRLGRKQFNPIYVPDKLRETSTCLGARTLLQLLGNYCRLSGSTGVSGETIKRSITVGVIGCPNVGKSSVINSLVRNRSCGVGATPGVTRVMTKVSLGKHIKMLDCPGLLPSTNATTNSLSLLSSLTPSGQGDPIEVAKEIYIRCPVDQLMSLYKLPEFEGGTDEFLAVLAHKKGKLKKKGFPDVRSAAKVLIQDWSYGKIRFYKLPPESKQESSEPTLVAQWSAEFDIKSLLESEEEELGKIKPADGIGIELGEGLEQVKMDSESDENSDITESDDDGVMDHSNRNEYCIYSKNN